jgi:hypothetical protein
MMAINGRIQREGEVVQLVAQQLFDLSGDLVGLADRDEEFKLPAGRHGVGLYRQESCRQQRRDEKYASFHIGPNPQKPLL